MAKTPIFSCSAVLSPLEVDIPCEDVHRPLLAFVPFPVPSLPPTTTTSMVYISIGNPSKRLLYSKVTLGSDGAQVASGRRGRVMPCWMPGGIKALRIVPFGKPPPPEQKGNGSQSCSQSCSQHAWSLDHVMSAGKLEGGAQRRAGNE